MGKDIKCNHFKLVKDVNQEVKDFVIECFAQAFTKDGEGAFTRDIIFGDPGIAAISPTAIFIPDNFKKLFHVVMTVDVTKQVEQEQTRRIITRGTVRGVTSSNQGSNEGKVD